MGKVEVSVICITYNQEKYIEETLESLLVQETNFDYEIIVHDDASTDNTAFIIKEYEKRFPNRIRAIYQKENQYSKGVRKITFSIFPYVKGKYIALCEGDDYWTDKNKLQKQYDIMEKSEEISLCTHKTKCINEDGTLDDKVFPMIEYNKNIMSGNLFLKYQMVDKLWLFHTTSYFFRKKDIEEIINSRPAFIDKFPVGDLCLQMFLLTKGDIYYIPEFMSVYRLQSIGSWSSRTNTNVFLTTEYCDGLREYNLYSKFKYAEYINYHLEYCEFLNIIGLNDFKKIFQKKYVVYYKMLPLKIRIYYFLRAFFPKVTKNILEIWKRRDKIGEQRD